MAPLIYVAPQADAIGIDAIYDALPGLYSAPSPVVVPRRSFADKAFAVRVRTRQRHQAFVFLTSFPTLVTDQVSLLRSGYESLDDLDCYPMDAWQKEFWLQRRAEWEPYQVQNEPLRIEQGDLSSPLYFDFIAAMQYVAIDHGLREPKQRFKEFCGEDCGEAQYRIVTRDGRYSDDARLPEFFADKVGEKVFGKLVELGAPLPVSLDDRDPISIAKEVVRYFVKQGFALKGEVDGSASDITIKMTGTATLWALRYLSSRRSRVLPLYDVYVVQYLLKRMGITSTVKLVDLTETYLTAHIQLG